MSAEKTHGIPLAKLLEPDSDVDRKSYRNLEKVMREKNADPQLRVALTRELLASRDKARALRTLRPKQKGDYTEVGAYLRKLVAAHPTLTGIPLWKIVDAEKLDGMEQSQFRHTVSAIRSELGLTKK